MTPEAAFTTATNDPAYLAARRLPGELVNQGWDVQGYDTSKIGDELSFGTGDWLNDLQSGAKFFNSAAKSAGYRSPAQIGYGPGSAQAAASSQPATFGEDGMYGIGGVSAVNPQAGQANELDAFKRYEDAAFANASGRLNPFLQQQQAQFQQQMANQGIPVGSDAYNKAQAQMSLGQTDAMNNAAFGAMGFGLGAQQQSFGQDHARSQLANSLLQAKMQQDLGMAGIGVDKARLAQDASQFSRGLGFDRDKLAQQASQFQDTLGLDYDKLGYDYDTFYDTLGQRAYEFDSGQDFDYWDRGNQYGLANRAMDSGDFWDAYNAGPTGTQRYDDALALAILSGMQPPGVPTVDPAGTYAAQLGVGSQGRGQSLNFLSNAMGGFDSSGILRALGLTD